jgi:hypothetical protein
MKMRVGKRVTTLHRPFLVTKLYTRSRWRMMRCAKGMRREAVARDDMVAESRVGALAAFVDDLSKWSRDDLA